MAAVAGVAAALATRVELLPEVFDLSSVPAAAGVGGLLATGCAAALRFPPDRLARITLLGNLVGAGLAVLGLFVGLAIEVL